MVFQQEVSFLSIMRRREMWEIMPIIQKREQTQSGIFRFFNVYIFKWVSSGFSVLVDIVD